MTRKSEAILTMVDRRKDCLFFGWLVMGADGPGVLSMSTALALSVRGEGGEGKGKEGGRTAATGDRQRVTQGETGRTGSPTQGEAPKQRPL